MSTKKISVANDFSDTPAGRFKSDGPCSGEEFRDEFIIPALKNYDKVIIDLDGTLGYGSSFLEESFGGILRIGCFDIGTIKKKLEIHSSRTFYSDRAWFFIQNSANQKK